MEAMEAIFSRRSIRKYTVQPVPEALIEQLLRAGMAAPSAANEQAWQFMVITERAILDQIPSLHPYAQMVKQAPLAILICGDPQAEKVRGMAVLDCAAATENILVAAQALGLGAVWLGVYQDPERAAGLRRLLGMPAHLVPVALLSVGYPAEVKPQNDRYDVSKVHRDRW